MLQDRAAIPELSILNRHPKSIDGPNLLHELVRPSSGGTDTAIDFLEDGLKRRRLTYEALHASSDVLADTIAQAVARLKDASAVVPVLLPQSPELYVSLLAILKAGRAFCPIGLDTPEDRLDFILKDVSADLIITNAAHKAKIPATAGVQVILADQELPEGTSSPREKGHRIRSSDLAYVLYTSGSTGLPKAVGVSHRAVTQSLLAHDRHIPRFARFLQFAAPTFDVSIFEIFFPLYRGCTLVGCTRAEMLDDLPGVINTMSVDGAELTPTVVSNLLRGRESVPRLNLLLTIGEMLTRRVIDEFGGNSSRESVLWGMYGPTEAAIHCTLQPAFSSEAPVGNIGFPLDTVSVLIVAPTLEGSSSTAIKVLPTGEDGELVLGGLQIAEGYLNRSELTASSFIEHSGYGRLYRTGDKARLRSDGTLECLGRIVSGQVKIRGQRVELGEIESILAKLDSCQAVAVMVIDNTLVAFCAVGSHDVSSLTVTEICKRWLPTYMVPAEVVFLQQMPQLASGKIDKKALEALHLHQRRQNKIAGPRPSDNADVSILNAVHDSLGGDLSLDTNLGSMGLDSLRSIHLASSLREQGYVVGAVDVLSALNVRELIALCKSKEKRDFYRPNASLKLPQHFHKDIPVFLDDKVEISDILPCTPLQEAMLAETTARPSAYCNWVEVELLQPHTLQQIREFSDTLAQKNETLRSGFFTVTGASESFAQVVWRSLSRSAIQEVTSFSKAYSLGSVESLLRPLTIQALTRGKTTRLLFQIHHALYDGWSFDLLLRDLADLINGRALIPRPHFRKVVEYYRRTKCAPESATSKAYWADLLRDYHPTPLPNFNGRTVRTDGLCSIRGKSIVDARSLFACAKIHTVNPQVFFQAAVAYICGLYLGSPDVVIGTVTSGRTIPVTHVERIIGPCIVSLPFRLDFSECSIIRDILYKTQKANRDMLQHCSVPLRDITKVCNLRPRERLFDVLFVWQQTLVSADEWSSAVRIVDSADDLESKVTLEFEPDHDAVNYRITYDPSTIPESQIRHLAHQVDQVARHFLRNVAGNVVDIERCFSTPSLSIANPTPKQEGARHGPSYTVEKWALNTPEREALIFGALVDGTMRPQRKLTYGSLNARANQLARALVEHGVGQNQLVCVLMDKSIDLYVSILAVLKVGSGYLPIAPDTPPDRVKRILVDAEVAVCISQSLTSTSIRQGLWTVLELDRLDLSQHSDQNLSIPYDESYLAYAVFTSGSTGKPKGVLVTQGNLMSNLEYLSSVYPVAGDARMLQACSQAFDVSVFEMFFSWYVGMCLCTATKDDLFYNFEAAIDCLDITHLSLTPTVAGLVNPSRVPKVKFLVTAGEALTENVRRKWVGKGLFQGIQTPAPLWLLLFTDSWIGYGPSETTNICTMRPYVTAEDLINNIGPPFSNTSAFVLNPGKDSMVPRGAIGELCFGGSQVFRGYLKRPELNAEKFINHPTYGRIYRSGDMGVLLPDDSILFTGRLDDQVKVRGQRVELGEITSIVLDNTAVQDAATVLIQYDHSAQRLVTFWVPKKIASTEFKPVPSQEVRSIILELFESLSLQLPSYTVPTHLIPITRIPMTTQAKTDKHLLRTTFDAFSREYLDSAASSYDTESGSKASPGLEQKLAEILAQTLDIPVQGIGRASSFFNLGLDSVSAIRLAKALRDAGQGHVPVSAILKHPTVERLSSVVARESQPNNPLRDGELARTNDFRSDQIAQIRSEFKRRGMRRVLRILPCTPLQEAMLSSPSSSVSSYCNTMVFQINGDVSRLKGCWALMVERHDILRTAFVPTNDPRYAFAQVVLSHEAVQWDQLEVTESPTTYSKEALAGLIKSHEPPIRLAIQETGTVAKLIFCCHHALYDGIAISTLLNEIQQIYAGSKLPPVVPYGRFLQHLLSQDFQAADRFWSTSLANFEPTLFPNLSGQTRRSTGRSFATERALESTLGEAQTFCQATSISLLSLIHASWAKLLSLCLGEDDICFGNVVSGRIVSEEDLDRLVAPCFNTLPVRLDFDFAATNFSLCKRLHSHNIDSLPFQLTPLRRIQAKALKDKGRLFDTLVILQQPSMPLDPSIWRLEEDTGEMDFPVVCEIFPGEGKNDIRLVLHYQDSILLKSDADSLAIVFDNILRSIISFPNARARDTVSFPSGLLAHSNLCFSQLASCAPGLLHSGFERNAVLRPHGLALDFLHADRERTALTFKALNERANQIAHALIQHGVKPEDIVPIHIGKSPEFYASVLGVLKAGAAFSPMHPDLPEARKRFMLSELRPRAMLCMEDALHWSKDMFVLNVGNLPPHSKDNPATETLRPTNLAYCLYTSGSTGVPKAVGMEHRSPIQTIESSRSLIPWSPNSRLLQYAAISFDMCYYDCFLAWSFGFALCAAEQEIMLNNLTDAINVLDADLLDLTPSVAASLSKADVPGVKWLYCIGEAMSPEVVQEWNGACVNSYGPTEAAFCTTIFPVRKAVKTSVIGKPFPTTSFAVFPPQGDRPVPVLCVGELYIGGAQLARGYFGKDALTDERFVQKCGQRFYRSGDMVRMLSDGNFEFLGRADDQVKIRGLRVELGEISHVLQACDDRVSATTTQILRTEGSAKDQLVSFLATRGPIDEDARSELRAKAKEAAVSQLPSYMVPHFYVFIDKIPKSLAGKVDKKGLAKMFAESEDSRIVTDEAAQEGLKHVWTEIESTVRHIFSTLSQVPAEAILPTTSIYQLGLDSISAVQIAGALRRQDLHVTASDVMKHMNCKDLAAYLEEPSTLRPSRAAAFDFESFEGKHRAAVMSTCNLKYQDVEGLRPCTPLQNGMLSQFVARDGAMYFNYLRLRLQPGIDIARLRDAWSKVVRKHRILRTGFAHVKDSNNPFVMIHYAPEAVRFSWDADAQPSLTVKEWLETSQQKAAKQLQRPPWCIRIVEQGDAAYLDLALLHALFDAQSLRLIFNDITAAYEDNFLGTAAPLDSVIATIIRFSTEEDAQRNEFWRRLGEGVTMTRLPNLSPLRYDPEPAVVITKVASKALADLGAGCRKANISLQAAGMASWAVLLSAYTGEPSATFGVVLSGRNFDAAKSAVFPCITTVPFICRISDGKDEIIRQVLKLNAEIQQHQFTPLKEIQRLIGQPNEPLFDTIFAFQKLVGGGSENDMWTVVDEKATIEYPMSIELEPKNRRLEYRLTFLPHIVPQEQAKMMLDQLDHLLQYIIFSDASFAADVSNSQSLYSVTPAKEPILPCQTGLLHELVEFTARKHPDRVALEFATALRNDNSTISTWTYAELVEEGNKIAHLLISHRVQPGELVGVCFDKCPEASFAMLGILKTGCAFVALDPGAPSARKEFIIQDASAKIVLSMKAQSTDIQRDIVRVVNLDETNWRSAPASEPSLERDINTQDRSYCLYTSGTTGTPKGCELTHENAVQALLSFQRLFAGRWDENSRWLQFASFHFDVSVLEQYWSWSVGICVVSAPRDLIFEDLATSIRRLGITHIDLTPSLARILHPNDAPNLCKGVFITGGESLKQEILDVWGPKGVIYNGYGPTEATIGVTMYPRVPANGKPSNIGSQFDNVGSYVLQPGSDVPVLRGGVGELCVSGKLVGKGYLNCPDLTSQRFPHLGRFDERVYRTGDLVRILHDGTFEFLGRVDDQVKLRGQRLEIGEINSVIKQSGPLADVATLILKHPKQQKEQLVSFIATESGKKQSEIVLSRTSDIQRAKNACLEKLPPYMIPSHFVPLTAMPLSANNKADGKRLREMYATLSANDLQRLSASGAKCEKWSKQEEKIRDVLQEALEIEVGVSKDTSFFELGMDSISVIGVSRALKQAGFTKASASVIMNNATIRRLGKALSSKTSGVNDRASIVVAQQAITAAQHRHRRAVAETLFIDTRQIEALAPCTPLQQGMIARSLESDRGLYFNTFRFKLSKDVDRDRLQDAWERVFRSIQILRTVFVNTDDGFMQIALRITRLHFENVDLEQDDTLDHYLVKRRKDWVQSNQTNVQRPLELMLLETPNRKIMVVHLFHALYDGNSVGLIFKYVWNSYHDRGIDAGIPFQSALSFGPLRLVDGAKEFWLKHLAGNAFRPFPPLNDRSNDASPPPTIAREVGDLQAFEAVRRKLNVTAQAITQACWMSVLHRRLKSAITLGVVVSGRSIDFEGAHRVIGPLFNTIPYHCRPQQRDTWASLIKRTHDFNVAAHPYQHTPLRDIMKWCNRGRSQPLFDALFVYQATDVEEEWLKNDIWELLDGVADADYPLAIEVEQRRATLKLTLVAQGHVSDEESSNQLLNCYEQALREALNDPDAVLETQLANGDEPPEIPTYRDDAPTLSSLDGTKDFEWTGHADIIRREIASLADADVANVNEDTSIFELGLDSIDAIKLSSMLKKRGVNLPVSGIVRGFGISNMMQHIVNDKPKWFQGHSDMIFKSHKRRLESFLQRQGLTEGVERILPLTPLQEAMVAEMRASAYTRYYNHDVLKLALGTDFEKLRKAWTTVVAKSPILRTSFIEVDDPGFDFSFAQVIHQSPQAFWKSIELNVEPDFPTIFESIREEATKQSIAAPLFHVRLIGSPSQAYIVLSIAHALYDGWSLGLLHADVNKAYAGRFKPRPGYEPALVGILSTSGSDATAFWRDYLSDAKSSTFPRRSRAEAEDQQAVHRKEQGSIIGLRDIISFARKNNVTLQTIGQTVYALVLASYTQTLDVTFGSVLSGRDDDERAKILFPTMNTVAIRTILHGNLRDMLQYVQENLMNIKLWQHFPLRKALSLAGVQGPLFESLFIYQKRMEDGPGEEVTLYESVEGHSDVEYPVCVEMEVVGGELVWRCAVKEVFDEGGAQELLDRLDQVLGSVMDQPDTPTIAFTSEGTSICGLPACKNERTEEPDGESESETEATTRFESPTAKAIREVLAFVSKTPKGEITTSMTLFHIGLDSISAIKVSSLLRKGGIILSVGEMLKAGTIEKMAQMVERRAPSLDEDSDDTTAVLEEAVVGVGRAEMLRKAGINESDVERILPASAGQAYMLSVWLNSGGALFYPEFTYQVDGAVSFDTLHKAWQKLVATNPILRTAFVATQEKRIPYVQVVLHMTKTIVREVTHREGEQLEKAMSEQALKQPYAHLFIAKSSTGWYLRLKIHHALYDGVSLPLLMQQLQDFCKGVDIPQSSNTFSKLITTTCASSTLEKRKAFWKNYLKGVEQRHLRQPTSPPTSKIEIFKPGLLPHVSSLDTIARKHGITTQSLFLAVYAKHYAVLTSTPTGQDVVICIYLANRSLPIHGIAQAAIPTVNVIPLRVSAPRETDIIDVAAQIQYDIQEISSLENASVSLWEVKEWAGVKIDTFVNFLKLPHAEQERASDDNAIKSTQTGQWSEEVGKVTEMQHGGFEAPEAFADKIMDGAYLVSLDRIGWIDGG